MWPLGIPMSWTSQFWTWRYQSTDTFPPRQPGQFHCTLEKFQLRRDSSLKFSSPEIFSIISSFSVKHESKTPWSISKTVVSSWHPAGRDSLHYALTVKFDEFDERSLPLRGCNRALWPSPHLCPPHPPRSLDCRRLPLERYFTKINVCSRIL